MNQILTDEEIFKLQYELQYREGGFHPIPFARAIEQAILNKLSAQEPFGYYENGRWSIVTDGGPDKWRARKEYTGPLYLHPAPSVPEGYQLVPIEPTEVMIAAGRQLGDVSYGDIYKAMLSAARSE